MGRRGRAAATAVAAAVAFAGSADAGAPAIDDRGNFLVFDVEVLPPVAGTRAAPQPVTLRYDAFFGNRAGETPPAVETAIITGPMRFNAGLLPACRLEEDGQPPAGDRCPAGARVGSGRAEVQVGAAFYPVSLVVYNGERRNGNPTLIFAATTSLDGTAVRSELVFEIRRARTRTQLVQVPPAEAAGPPPTITQSSVTLGRSVTVRRRGRTVRRGYIEAPTTCRRSWRFSETNVFDDGTRLTATDAVACMRARVGDRRPLAYAG